MDKPTSGSGYPIGLAVEARRMCLYVATLLGDLKDDVVVVGGLVPYLIVDQTPMGELACRTVRVCGPAAFVVLKAHAFHNRGEPKDAYDLVYVLKHYGDGDCREVAARFSAIATMPPAGEALEFLAADFASPEHHGASRAAAFHGGRGRGW